MTTSSELNNKYYQSDLKSEIKGQINYLQNNELCFVK